VSGIALGGTWFWPADRRARIFSRVMSSRPLQWAILERNLFVERFVPSGTTRSLRDVEMEHYRSVQPTREARVGVAELPRQIVDSGRWLADLERGVRSELGGIRALVTYPMRDRAFPAADVLPRMRAAFADLEVVELPDAAHYFVEDAPAEVAAAITSRFGQTPRSPLSS
jgi:haloalkane dehalogenase